MSLINSLQYINVNIFSKTLFISPRLENLLFNVYLYAYRLTMLTGAYSAVVLQCYRSVCVSFLNLHLLMWYVFLNHSLPFTQPLFLLCVYRKIESWLFLM